MAQYRSITRLRACWAAVTRRPDASVRELAAELCIGYGRAAELLRTLAALGYIEIAPRRTRARRIVVPFAEVRR